MKLGTGNLESVANFRVFGFENVISNHVTLLVVKCILLRNLTSGIL